VSQEGREEKERTYTTGRRRGGLIQKSSSHRLTSMEPGYRYDYSEANLACTDLNKRFELKGPPESCLNPRLAIKKGDLFG